MSETLRPLLASSREALEEASDRFTAMQTSRLRDLSHAVERHVIAFRGSIDLTQADLDRVAGILLEVAPRVPRAAATDLRLVYGGIARMTRARLPATEILPSEALRSAGIIRAFVDRQTAELHGIRLIEHIGVEIDEDFAQIILGTSAADHAGGLRP